MEREREKQSMIQFFTELLEEKLQGKEEFLFPEQIRHRAEIATDFYIGQTVIIDGNRQYDRDIYMQARNLLIWQDKNSI